MQIFEAKTKGPGLIMMSAGKPMKSPSAALKALEGGSSVVFTKGGKTQREFTLGNQTGVSTRTSTLDRSFEQGYGGAKASSRVNFLTATRQALDTGMEVRAINNTGLSRAKGYPTR